MDHVIRRFDRFEDLPPSYEPLRDELLRDGVFGDPAWFELLLEHGYEGRDRLCLLTMEEARTGRPLLLAPMRWSTNDGAARGAQVLATIHHVENYASARLAFDGALAEPDVLLAAFFGHLRRPRPDDKVPAPDLIRLMPVAAGSPVGDRFYRALRAAGWWVQGFANSFNWYEDTIGLSHADYLASRSTNLRDSIRRRRRALERSGDLEVSITEGTAGLERAILDYLKVSQTSWKDPRSMADPLTLAMLWLAAQRGDLRLGVLRLGGEAVAVQFWLVAGGTGHCVRLAYDQAFAQRAVGVVLTDMMIERLLDVDRVKQIDFGFGEEEYKGRWMRQQRVFAGLLAFNPMTRRGMWQAVRHLGGRPIKRTLRSLASRVGLRAPDTEVDRR